MDVNHDGKVIITGVLRTLLRLRVLRVHPIEHPSISAPLRPTKGVLAKQGKAWAYLRLCRLAHCMDINFDISSTPPRYLGGDSTIGRNCSTAGACLHVQQYQPDPEASQASHVL